MTEWQPIETAPKDGTYVQLWRGPADYGRWMPLIWARWWTFEDGNQAWVWPDEDVDLFSDEGRELADDLIENGDCYEDAEHFTHWMPLPTPPSQNKEASNAGR